MKVGQGIESGRASWSFDGAVTRSFDEHVLKSVPLYEEGHALICQLSDFFLSGESTVYELGCSTGALIRKLAEFHSHRPTVRWVGIDCSEAMAAAARERCKDLAGIDILCDDILNVDFAKSDMIVAYYTMQFIPESRRQELFNRIYESLNWGGAFLLFEKVGAPDARFQEMMGTMYREFKAGNGFAPDEILNKELSLKGVLRPFSSEGNHGLLRRAGFVDYMTVMKYICFEGFLAVK